MAKNIVHKLADGYQMIYRPSDDTAFDSCFECGDAIDHGEKVFFAGEDDGCPLCSLECAKARRQQLEDCKRDGLNP